MLTIAAITNLDLKHWDIVAAFVNGHLSESVYMRQPIGFEDGTSRVCLLKSSLYSLCQSARAWYQRLDEILAQIGWKRLHSDYVIWTGPNKDEFVGAHVDDMAVAARKSTRSSLKRHFRKYLSVTNLRDLHLYVGLQISRNRDLNAIYLSQSDYTRKVLKMFSMETCNAVTTPLIPYSKVSTTPLLDENGKKQYQRLIGCLLYLMHCTRPDLAHAVIKLSQFAAAPQQHHWEDIKCILRYLRVTTEARLILGNRDPDNNLIGFFDAAHGDAVDRRSTGGYIFLYHGSPIS